MRRSRILTGWWKCLRDSFWFLVSSEPDKIGISRVNEWEVGDLQAHALRPTLQSRGVKWNSVANRECCEFRSGLSSGDGECGRDHGCRLGAGRRARIAASGIPRSSV